MSDLPKRNWCPIGPLNLHTLNYEKTECIWCGPNQLAPIAAPDSLQPFRDLADAALQLPSRDGRPFGFIWHADLRAVIQEQEQQR